MNLKNYILISIILIISIGSIVSGMYYMKPYLWLPGIILLVISYVYVSSPKTSIKKLLSICEKYSGNEKLEKSKYLTTNSFKKRLKFDIFKNFSPKNISSVKIKTKNDVYTNYLITLENGKSYDFQMIKRNKILDERDIYTWVVDDITGSEFDKKYNEI